jgi:glycosyltransferase involved in cell wall biosynthesis
VRIALFTTSFPSTADAAVNAGVCVRDFAAALTALGHEVEVLTPYKRGARHGGNHRDTRFFRWLGSSESLSHISLRSPLGLLQLASVVVMGTLAAARLLVRLRPDHVLCFWVFPCGFWARVAGALTGTRYSVWALGSDIWTLGKIRPMRCVLRWLGRRATRRYADGVALARDFEAIAGMPVDFLATSRVLDCPETVMAGEGGYYLYLGRYHPNKGIDLLIEAVGLARATLPADFRLRVHGFGPLERALRARVHELGLEGMVEIGGPTAASEVAGILRRARGLIIPSRIESVPLVLSDALQTGVPVLVTDVGDMGVLVSRYRAGQVCRANADDLAKALSRFARDPAPAGNAELRALLDIRESARRFAADLASIA